MTARNTATALHLVEDLDPGRAAWDREVAAYRSHLEVGAKSPATITTYLGNLESFARWREGRGLDLDPMAVTRQEAKAWAADLVRTTSPNTAKGRIVTLGTFFRWMVEEWTYAGVTRPSPLAGVAAPRLPKVRVPVVSDGDLDALLDACSGRTFDALRDRAIILLLAATGLRRSEVAALLVSDVDPVAGVVQVVQGKGGKDRLVRFGPEAQEAVRHYVRARGLHRDAQGVQVMGRADRPRQGQPLWLVTPGHGHQGAMSGHAIAVMLARRAAQAGVPHVHPHQLRHTFAHAMLANGTPEGEVMRLGGWDRRDMLDRYGADLAQERAVMNYRDPLARRRRR